MRNGAPTAPIRGVTSHEHPPYLLTPSHDPCPGPFVSVVHHTADAQHSCVEKLENASLHASRTDRRLYVAASGRRP